MLKCKHKFLTILCFKYINLYQHLNVLSTGKYDTISPKITTLKIFVMILINIISRYFIQEERFTPIKKMVIIIY